MLLSLQAGYAGWLEALPDATRDSPTGQVLQAIVDLDLDEIAAIQPPRGYGRDERAQAGPLMGVRRGHEKSRHLCLAASEGRSAACRPGMADASGMGLVIPRQVYLVVNAGWGRLVCRASVDVGDSAVVGRETVHAA